MRVSVIIPAYNAENTLGECLDSLLAQDYDNYEIIVVDDGSEDNTQGVAESYGSEKIVCVRQSNGGVSAARNAGIALARGEYVIFCDADDCVSPHYVRTLMDNADGDWLVVGAVTESRELLDCEDTETASATFRYLDAPESFVDLLKKFYIQGPYCKAFKKSLIQRYGMRFSHDMNYAEDVKFSMEYLYHVKTIRVVNWFLYFYNKSNSFLSRTANERVAQSYFAYCQFISDSFHDGHLAGSFIRDYFDNSHAVFCYTFSLLAYETLPYYQARSLQNQVRSHPAIRACIERCQWDTLNDYPGMGRKMKFFLTQNSGLVWAFAGLLKRWKNRLKRWT